MSRRRRWLGFAMATGLGVHLVVVAAGLAALAGGVWWWWAPTAPVRAHHWRFGDMPPRPEVSASEIEAITRYIRELQKANGIG